MRTIILLIASTAITTSTAGHAADQLKFGKAPAWVIPQVAPADSNKTPNAPAVLLLADQQVQFEPGKTTSYGEIVMKIQTPEGLSAGNISLPWNPATDTITINKLEIQRGKQVIDVLASGQTFTTMRRESNLELATLDGVLTANIQPDGLQEGDIIDLATTTEHVDPVLGNHVEGNFAEWERHPIGLAHARVEWPSSLHMSVRLSGGLPQVQPVEHGGRKVLEITARDLQPDIAPKGAPPRFALGRLGEATDFTSWSDIAKLMTPLFQKAEAIPSTGPLHEEVEKIRTATSDPRQRAILALQLVQQRVRYVALLMGQGSYVPAKAETTWSQRFGDCKAKTALLLGILHSLGIEAQPILVQSRFGDAIAERLPLLSYFDHVLVRAEIAGKTYYLDGTRIGDMKLDDIAVPEFHWGLPLVPDARLVGMVPPPHDVADTVVTIDVDARAGALAPAKVTLTEALHGDAAVTTDIMYARATDEQQKQVLTQAAKLYFDTFSLQTSSETFDRDSRDLSLQMAGTATLHWKDGWYFVPASSLAYKPDFDRPAGPFHNAPFSVSYPAFRRSRVILHLPPGFAAQQKLPVPVHQTLAGVEYIRTASVSGDDLTIETSERTIVPEIAYNEAIAAEPRIKALNDDDVYLKLVSSYRPTQKDVSAIISNEPSSPADYLRRGNVYLATAKFDEAIADFTKVLSVDPKNVSALADRALGHFFKHDFDSADADIKAADAIDPNNAILLRCKGLEAQRLHHYPEAITFFSRSLVSEPKNAFTLVHLAELHTLQSEPQKALQYWDLIIELAPGNADMLAYRAVVEARLGKLDDARKDLVEAKTANPASVTVVGAASAISQYDHDFKAQVVSYSKLITANPKLAEAYAARSAALFGLGDLQQALSDTDTALMLGAKSVQLHVLRANIFKLNGNDSGVQSEADAMVRDNPNSELAYVAAAKTFASLGHRDQALQAVDKALAIKPEPYIYVNRAEIRPVSDDADRTSDYDAALKLQPNEPDALIGKADILNRQGKFAEAASLYELAAKDQPDWQGPQIKQAAALYKAGQTAEAAIIFANVRAKADAAKLNSLCWINSTAGILLDSALQDCRNALKSDPDNQNYLNSLGMVLLKLGQIDDALAAFNRGLAIKPSASCLMGRAIVYARKGNRVQAEADAAAARKLNPGIDDVYAVDYGLKL